MAGWSTGWDEEDRFCCAVIVIVFLFVCFLGGEAGVKSCWEYGGVIFWVERGGRP